MSLSLSSIKEKLKSWASTFSTWFGYVCVAAVIGLTLLGLYFLYTSSRNTFKRKEYLTKIKAAIKRLKEIKSAVDEKEAALEETKQAVQTAIEEQATQLEAIDVEYDQKFEELYNTHSDNIDVEAYLRSAGLVKEGEDNDNG